jgi:hypothetical protein
MFTGALELPPDGVTITRILLSTRISPPGFPGLEGPEMVAVTEPGQVRFTVVELKRSGVPLSTGDPNPAPESEVRTSTDENICVLVWPVAAGTTAAQQDNVINEESLNLMATILFAS